MLDLPAIEPPSNERALVGHAAVQALAAAGDVLEKVVEVRLEVREDLIGVILRADAHLAFAGHGVIDDLLGTLLGKAHDLLFARKVLGLALGVLEECRLASISAASIMP